jgi:hypothetical protein
MDDSLKRNLTSGSTWLRAVYMILFGVIFYVVEFVLLVVAVVQFLFKLFTGASLPRIDAFGASLAAFVRDLVAYLTFASDAKPFPFAAWPAQEGRVPARVESPDAPPVDVV